MKKIRLVMMGGFLGGGKTSAMLRLATYLREKRSQVAGLVTNDQSVGLIDTARAASQAFTVGEITGSCFCCNYDGLMSVIEIVEAECSPDVIIAEPVGSCTDLKATVCYPIVNMHGGRYDVAPLSVLIDPVHFAQSRGFMEGTSFDQKIDYIYAKQLEEADFIVINKVDLLLPDMRKKITETLRHDFPRARIFEVSCITGEGLEAWFEEILSYPLGTGPSINVDYDVYAAGEALMGWLNATMSIERIDKPLIDADLFLSALCEQIDRRLCGCGIKIAHLKMGLFDAESGRENMVTVSLVRSNSSPFVTNYVGQVGTKCRLLVNLRAEADPEILRKIVREVLEECEMKGISFDEIHAFRPGRPQPTHRMAYC